MSTNETQQLIDEVAKLRETGEALVERVEDVAASIRYMTNNLLDDQYHPEMASAVRDLAQQTSELVSLSSTAEPAAAASAFADRVNGTVQACEEVIAGYHDRDAEEPRPALPDDVRWRIETLIANLHKDASQLDAARSFGSVTEHQWWQNRSAIVRDNLQQLEMLQEVAAEQGVELQPYYDDLGGIPPQFTDVDWENVSEEEAEVAVTAAGQGSGNDSREGVVAAAGACERQQQLFSEEAATSVATVREPAASESRESQAGGMDSLDSHHRPADKPANTKTLPLSEAIYEPYGFEDRVSYAKHCLLDGDTDHRDFDTCFEMHDGRLVVVRLLQLARTDRQLAVAIEKQNWSENDDRYANDLALEYDELIKQARVAVDEATSLSDASDAAEEDMEEREADLPAYSYEDWQAFYDQLQAGEITADELKRQFAAMRANQSQIVETLVSSHNAKELKAWCRRWNRRGDGKKQENAESLVSTMLSTFSVGQSIRYSPFDGETYEDAVAKAVEAVTDDDIARVAAEQAERDAALEKAITNPETPQEWSLYVRSVGGYQKLDTDKKIQYERVRADQTRADRANRQTKEVGQLAIDEDLSFTIKEGYHDKKERPLWIVQLSSRVERSTFAELKTKAKEFGGWYSSFKKDDAGFQFWDEPAAKLFTDLLDGDVDNSEAVAARKIRKMTNASERFHAVADTLEDRCDQVLENDETKLKNTVRRASMAAGMREDAQAGLATVKTLRALGDQLAAGEIKYLDGLNAATQLYTLTQLLRAGKYDRIRQETNAMREDRTGVSSHLRYEELSAQQLCEEDIAFAQYPHPHIYREHLEQAFTKLGDTPGVKRSTAKMRKLIGTADPEQSSIEFKNEGAVEVLADFLQRAKAAGYTCYWFEHCLERYERMRAANIHNVFELRTALRELLPYVAEPEGDDPVMQAEDALRGKKLEGFFPTPRRVIHEMLEYAQIDGTDRVLEPSAGKGDILDAIADAHPDVELHGIEYNRTLKDVLAAKGYDDVVTFGDFLQHEGRYDKIVMNPPFEKGADIDHVRHAYELLEEGGRVVAVMCQGPFFRSDSKSKEFRQWLESLDDVHDEELPEDAFQGVESFRQTGVRTRLVIINKTNA